VGVPPGTAGGKGGAAGISGKIGVVVLMNINRGSIGAFFLDQLLKRVLQYSYDVASAANIRVGVQIEVGYITYRALSYF